MPTTPSDTILPPGAPRSSARLTNSRRSRPWALLLPGALAATLVAGCGDATPHDSSAEEATSTSATFGLRRIPDEMLIAQTAPADISNAWIVIKFREGTDVRMEGTRLTANDAGDPSTSARPRDLARRELVQRDLERVTERLSRSGTRVAPVFRLPKGRLTQLKERGEKRTGRPLADLSLYFEAPWRGGSRSELLAHVEALNALDSVEIAYVQPAPEKPAAPTFLPSELASSMTPDFTHLQGYVENDPNGIGVDVARAFPGGRGEHVRIIDIETDWTADHEDLPAPFFYLQNTTAGDGDHGTGVAGVLVGIENEFGVTGISPLAGIGYASHMGTGAGVGAAFTAALNELEAGDVLLLEMQFGGAPTTSPCTCSGQCNSVPTEYYQSYFDAIQTATANGIVVVEAAGNGEANLDDPAYGGLFDRSFRDSGAIMVGASSSTSRTPMCFSNYGDRVDVHAWGQNVTTTGGGNLYSGPLGAQDEYTHTFSGTSSASPIVAGAAALLQSIAWAENDAPLSPQALRDLLVSTGKPQQADLGRAIGPLPDLATAAPLVGGLTTCGNASCDAGETCESCPGDCGPCTSSCVPAGCEQASTVSVPYTVDGSTNTCVFFEGPASNVNSWNMDLVEINDVDITNTWVGASNFPATCDGGYYLRATSSVPWAHLEVR